MANPRWTRYKDGRIDALKRVALFCGRKLARVPAGDRNFHAFCEVINYCGAASDLVRAGKQWHHSAPGLNPRSRRIP